MIGDSDPYWILKESDREVTGDRFLVSTGSDFGQTTETKEKDVTRWRVKVVRNRLPQIFK